MSVLLKPAFALAVLAGLSAGAAETFTWTSGASGNWDDDGVWTASGGERTAPGLAGDTAVITTPGVTVAIGENKVVGMLDLKAANLASAGEAVRLTLQGEEGAPATLQDRTNGAYSRSYIGKLPSDDALVLNLASPLNLNLIGADWQNEHCVIVAKITGGSKEARSDITYTATKTTFVYLLNPNNDFRGNWILSGPNNKTLFLGWQGLSAKDSMLGDPANEVFFGDSGCTLGMNTVDSLKRKVHGTGTISGFWQDSTYFIGDNRATSLALGEGCELDPSRSNSPYGEMSVNGSSVSVSAATTFKMSVGLDGNDVIRIKPKSAFTFRGVVTIDEVDEVAEGSQFTLFTIDKGAGRVTFAPDAIPEGYNFVCDGSAADGWTVVATKLRDGADVTALGTTLIADTYATFNCNVFQIGASPVTIRAYYGTTDGGDDPSAWGASAVVAENVVEKGDLSCLVQGLSNDTTYFVRFGADDGQTVQMSLGAVSFTTRDYLTPDTFTWNFSGSAWSDAGAWTIAGPYARQNPGAAGDVVRFPSHASHQVLVDGDYTVGKMYLENGQNQTVKLTAAEPHVLTLDNGSDTALLESGSMVYHWYFGTSTTDGLSLYLASPLKISRTQAYNYDFWLYSKLSGGTAASPVPITLSCTSDQYGRLWVHLFNTDNDFIGDWFVGIDGNANGNTILYLGDATHPSVDSMLGDADNRIMLRSLSTLAYFAGTSAASCRRQISGDGAVSCTGDLVLTDEAELSPCGKTGTGFGTIKVTATGSLSDTAATTYRINVSSADSSSSDAIELTATGSLSVAGTFVITPDDPEVKIAAGTRWTIGALKGAGFSGRKRFAASPGYRVFAEGDDEQGWTLYAEKTTPGLLLIVK